MSRSKERLRPYIINSIVGLIILALPAYADIAEAQDCYDNEGNITSCEAEYRGNNTDQDTNLPPLIIPDLLPSSENIEKLIYDQAALFAPDGNIVKFYYLTDETLINQAPIIKIEELVLPIGDEYYPGTQRGYFNGHLAWDVTYRQVADDQGEIDIQSPHPEAILLAAFDDIPVGEIAQRIQSSGSMEIFYLKIDDGEKVKPYLITFTHLTPESVRSAVDQAKDNDGFISQAGQMGDTGLTDGKHIHMQVIDLDALYEIFNASEPITAYGLLADLENQISDDELLRIFINPSLIYPQLDNM